MFSVIVNKPNKNNLISTDDDCSKIASLKALIKTLKPVIICAWKRNCGAFKRNEIII